MAKINHKKEYSALNQKSAYYARMVQKIFDTFTNEITASAIAEGYDGSKYFQIDDYPETKRLFQQLQKKSMRDTWIVIVNGITAAWEDSNFKNDKLVQSILGNKASFDEYAAYFNNNKAALNSFINRQRNGLNLSQRIWKLEDSYKYGLEAALSAGIESGKSAADLSRDVREYLREPEKLFRRIAQKNDNGDFVKWNLSKNALKYNPGGGSYRSSYKNAIRLTRTEINMAYRTADQTRWAQLDFVVGYEVRRSATNPYDCDMCQSFAGKYPKDFVFASWHPNCRCYCIPILKTEEEMDHDDELIMSGKKPSAKSDNKVHDVPDGYKRWIAEHEGKIHQSQKRGTLPFFLRDNPYSQYLKG